MYIKCAGAGFVLILTTSVALAEPTPPDINNYFNPRPDADTDLDGIIDLQHKSDMQDGTEILNGFLDYDQFAQDVDNQYDIHGNLALGVKKSNGIDIGLGASYAMRSYVAEGTGGVDSVGQIFSLIDSGTADPRSFWYASAELGFGYVEESEEDNPSEVGISVGVGRGRVYNNLAFHQAWALTEKLSASGNLSGTPSTDQLYALAKIIDERTKYNRLATDEAHGLPLLNSIQHGKYERRWYKEIWQYLSAQGLVSGSADLDAVFDMHYIFNERGFFNWKGGAEIKTGLDFKSKDEIDNGLDDFSTTFSSLGIVDPTNNSDDDNISIFASYLQYWPINISTGASGSAKVAITDSSLLAARVSAGYQRELSDYLWMSSSANLAMAAGSNEEIIGLSASSTLVYELSPRASLITSANAATGTDLDFTYNLGLKLAYDLL